ncbi:DUF6491 family protein [Maricaulis sp.]|uniref:DUF6491 family protein n=1 Tax=Maricaulis sp. TaxID=1486257 RepID=UPI00260D8D87|nr:DUF6491 family protein [Maricaulis sp.]
MKIAASITTAAIAACLMALPATADEGEEERRNERVRLVHINGYTVMDNEHLLLRGGVSRRYLVTMQRQCFGLRAGVHIRTSFGRTQTIYSPQFEYITTREGRCYIRSIEEVDSEEAARILIEQRAAADAAEDAEAGSR